MDVIEDMPQGRLHLRVHRSQPSDVKIVHEPAVSAWNNTEKQIRAAIRKKKRQARAAIGPTLVAIHVGGITGEFEDFDRALFGHSVMELDESRTHARTRFAANGTFAVERPQPPVIDGVLALLRVGIYQFAEPILYLHPRSSAVLPSSLLALERRLLAPSRDNIVVRPSENRGFLASLGFVHESV